MYVLVDFEIALVEFDVELFFSGKIESVSIFALFEL